MITFYKFWVGVVISSFLIVLSGCSINNPLSKHALALSPENLEQLSPTNAISSSTNLLEERRSAETSKYYVPTISAVGFSSIAISAIEEFKNQRRLMAMRAAKLDAYRSLTEQIHGIYIQGETTVGKGC